MTAATAAAVKKAPAPRGRCAAPSAFGLSCAPWATRPAMAVSSARARRTSSDRRRVLLVSKRTQTVGREAADDAVHPSWLIDAGVRFRGHISLARYMPAFIMPDESRCGWGARRARHTLFPSWVDAVES